MPIIALSLAAAALPIPFLDEFRGSALDPAWSIDVSDGNAIAARDGILEIRAAMNTYAHIERPLEVDRIFVACVVEPAPAISWSTSIFLYWSPGDWCQLGIIDRDGGRYFAVEMVDGQALESDLDRCAFDRAHAVEIELADDCIRYLAAQAGEALVRRRIVPRPPRLRDAPVLLILGKGYGRGEGSYPKPDLDNDYGDRGAMGTSRIHGVWVGPLSPDRIRATPEEKYAIEMVDRDPYGSAALEAKDEPSFASVARLFPPIAHPREAVGVKDHPHDIGVAEDGTIELSDDRAAADAPIAWFEIGDPPVRFGAGGCARGLLDGYLPIVALRWERDGLTFEETVFGASDGMSPGADLFAYVRLRAIAPEGGAKEAKAATSAKILLRARPAPSGRDSPRSLPVLLRVPFGKPAEAAEIDAPTFDAAMERARETWRRWLEPAERFNVPEPMVRDALRAWFAYGFVDTDKRGEIYEPHDGSGFYEAIYGYSAALWCHALDLSGFHADARRYLESLLALQARDGSFIVNYGLPDNGALLFAIVQHYRLTGDAPWLKGVAPKMVRMCDWLIARRKESMTDDDGRRPLAYGLIRCRPYCDSPQASVDYYGDAYSCAGIEATSRAFAEIGLAEEGRRLAAEGQAYRTDILSSMDASIIERDGLKILPMEPDTHRLLKSTGYRAGGYYGLVASMMLESGFLAPSDPRAVIVGEFLRAKGGLILGLSEFAKGVDHAYTYGYWMQCLDRDEADRVVLAFYATLAYGMTRGTCAGVEVTQILTGDNTATTPHLYSSTQQIRLLRMMLLREDGDRLRIAPAIPRAWLASGKRIEVRDAPTTFGPVSFTIESPADGGPIVARIRPPVRRPPRAIVVTLRRTDERPIRRATVAGGEAVEYDGETIRFRPTEDAAVIEAWTRAPE
ncbi:MAG: hypothetical protein JXP34_14240 [Planctomycetes bacterium]|nr:hypothetical protein [Planctomycetota bacterium]